MPKDVSSSSSSEDEAKDSTAPSPAKSKDTEKKNSRYQCPGDFVSFCYKSCSNTLTDKLKGGNNELWLIKVPSSFEPECFSGIKVPLSGFQTLKVAAPKDGTKTGIYSIMASTHGTSELRLLTGHERSSDGVTVGPAFSGLLNVCETCGDSSTNLAPQIIPAAPAPTIPPGLKQRFHPFGSKTPTLSCTAESQVDGASSKRVVEEAEEEEEEGRKKKKKRKKEKHIKTEPIEEEVKVKEEPGCESPTQDVVMMELPSQEDEGSEEKRKKKKKKKDREKQEEAELVPEVKEEEVTVKCERVDASEADALDASGKKKKKKKKKSKDADD